MRSVLGVIAIAGVLGACADKSAYEASVEAMEPVYCYQSLAGVSCYNEPYHRDGRRLVNYFGPAPKRYDAPAPTPAPQLSAPEAINYWVKDPEPIPRAAPSGDLADRPWLDKTAKPAQLADQTALAPRRQPVRAVAKATPKAGEPTAAGDDAGLLGFLDAIMKPSSEDTSR